MPRSYEHINYNLRPAKQIERKMLCEAFRRLCAFGSLTSYRYVGFGSIYFRDFVLLHRDLGIPNMISIEGDPVNEKRFQFNCPFGCIKLRFGHSNEVLPELTWDVRTILWLDYDYPLDSRVLTDVSWFCANAISGSVLVITVDARVESPADALDDFCQRIGPERIPPGTRSKDLAGWGFARLCRRVITNHIDEELNRRNGGRMRGTRYLYRQLFHFHYEDSAKMLTVGGLLYDEGQEPTVQACGFAELSFTSPTSALCSES